MDNIIDAGIFIVIMLVLVHTFVTQYIIDAVWSIIGWMIVSACVISTFVLTSYLMTSLTTLLLLNILYFIVYIILMITVSFFMWIGWGFTTSITCCVTGSLGRSKSIRIPFVGFVGKTGVWNND